MRFFKSFVLALVFAAIISSVLVLGFYNRLDGTEIKTLPLLTNTTPTTVYDANNNVIQKFYSNRRSIATYSEIPQEIIDSIVSTEDRDFFHHAGFNVKSMARAASAILKADGELVQGGSTLTQQLIKNTNLNSSKTFNRKFQEIVYSTVLEQQFSKEQIFDMYINNVSFLWRAYGVKDALMTYFGQTFDDFKKLPREKRIAEASLITGLLQNPNLYDPFRQPQNSLNRRNDVITNMKNNNKITETEYESAIKLPLLTLKSPKMVFDDESVHYPELVTYALNEASKKLDVPIKDIMNGGYEIHTSFNTDIYNILRMTYRNNNNFPANAKDGTKVESAAVLLNPKNGELYAFTGGREEPTPNDFLNYNRAYMIKKQPGSTIKPVITYGPALESGKFTPYSLLLDEKGHEFPGGYVVKDWDNSGRGQVTMREALRESWNIPAVWTLQQTGLGYAKDYAKKLGIDISNEDTLGIAIGGFQQGVSPFQMADSYQAFANNGVRTPAHAIRQIYDSSHHLVYKTTIETQPVINPQNANDMKDMLRNVVTSGTGVAAQVPGREIAGKTGTVEHPLIKGAANSDVWFVGFDEQFLASVWMGFDKTSKEHYLTMESGIAASLFGDFSPKTLDYIDKHGGLDTPQKLSTTPEPDSKPPVITLNGPSNVTINQGDKYEEQGATAKDDIDGDLTNKIVISGQVDTITPGTYTITYKVTDNSLNEASLTRTVVVKAKPVPITALKMKVEPYDNNRSFYITWDAMTGNIKYELLRDGTLLQDLDTNSYLDSSINHGNNYEYKVVAINNDNGQKAGESDTISITMPIQNTDTNTNTNTSTNSNKMTNTNTNENSNNSSSSGQTSVQATRKQ